MDPAARPADRIALDTGRGMLTWAALRRGSASREERVSAALSLLLAVVWLTYTRLYFYLHPLGLTFSPSPFMHYTGKPDPGCGLTRTFAWMWRGDLVHAFLVYPLGPILFPLVFVVALYLLWVAATGNTLVVKLSRRAEVAVIVVPLVALGLNWMAKLIWLGI